MKNRLLSIFSCAVWMLAVPGPAAAQNSAPAGPEAQPRAYFATDFTDLAQHKRLGTDDVELTERGVELPAPGGLEGVRAGRLRSSSETFEFAANAVTVLWKEDRPPGTDVLIEISVSKDGAQWERWYTVEEDPHATIRERYPDGRPNPNHGFTAGGLLSWGLERYGFFRYRITLASEVEASPSVSALRLFYQDSTLGREPGPPEKAGGFPQPPVCDRTCWAARAPQCTINQLTGISRGVIHHTASQTDWDTTSQADSAARVRAHQNFHMDGNGWCDIGYHFLADKLGNRFEGREGSLAGTPRGAHDGVNQDSIGVSLMGYLHSPHNQVPTQAMRDAAYDLVAWKVEDPFDGYGSGSYGAFSGIGFTAGHRDVSATACPGDQMYDTYIGTDFFAGDARDGINARVTGGGGIPCCPGPPTLSSVVGDGNGDSITVTWSDAGTVANYHLYTSTDGTTFGSAVVVASGTTSYVDAGIGAGQERYYKVTAVGSSQESAPSDVYGAVSDVAPSAVLIVDGNDRWNFQSGENPSGANHDFATYAAAAMGGATFDTVDNGQVENGTVSLAGYGAVVWLLGEESTAQESFGTAEQNAVAAYLDAGGNLFVSGAEIGWDLVAQGSTADQTFYETYLKAVYVADDAGTYDAEPFAGGLFDGIGSISFSGGLMDIGFPDRIDVNGGSELALSYVGGGQFAGVSYSGAFRVVNMGFPFESVNDPVTRLSMMDRVLDFLIGCTLDSECDDGAFCNGAETCDVASGTCQAGTPPACDDGAFCNGAETCNEGTDSCDAGTPPTCDDGVGCTDDSCNAGTDSCDNVANDANCDNGLFCDGAETCDAVNDCQTGSDPCPGQSCDENADVCVPGNTAPSVTITAPPNGSSFNVGDPITFSGTASDAEDGNISANLSWTSSIDGAIGTGASFTTSSLSVGSHTITASVTDSGGLSGSDSINVTVVGICLPKGASCVLDSECCSNKCKGKSGAKRCK